METKNETTTTPQMPVGFSLNELLVVIAIVALLVGIGLPAAKVLTESFVSSKWTVMIVRAALSNARGIAGNEGKYAGVRFQQDAEGNQYMIFIIHDPDAPPSEPEGPRKAWSGFRAVQGRKPLRLPVNAGVMDLRIGNVGTPPNLEINDDTHIDEDVEMRTRRHFR